jgi:hypothetical protein
MDHRLAVAAALLAVQPAFAGYFYEDLPWGDNTYPKDVNDHGEILYCCFGDAWVPFALFGGAVLQGEGGTSAEAFDVNNAGHVLGSSLKGGALVPTMWIDAGPYDLTDPANSGLHFEFDPGPKEGGPGSDLLRLNVLGLPDCFHTDACTTSGGWLTNARGDFVFRYRRAGSPYDNSAALWFDGHAEPASVPEPSSLLLLLAATLGWKYRSCR